MIKPVQLVAQVPIPEPPGKFAPTLIVVVCQQLHDGGSSKSAQNEISVDEMRVKPGSVEAIVKVC